MPNCQSDGVDLSPANLSCPEVYLVKAPAMLFIAPLFTAVVRLPTRIARVRTLVASAASTREYEEIPSFREVKWPEEWPFADEKL